jgi:hypothetical protein
MGGPWAASRAGLPLAVARLVKVLDARVRNVPPRLEAELLLGRALVAAGRAQEGKTRLASLAAEARQRGFVVIEREASQAR